MSTKVVITGASAGLGRAIALAYAKRGAALGLFARRLDRLETVAREARALGAAAVEVAPLDVAHTDAVAPAMDAMRARLGGLDVAIANAGITAVNRTGGGKVALDAAVLQTNLLGAIATLDAAARHFRAEKRGRLVGVSSVAAFGPIPGSGAYSASKAGLTSYLAAARAELRKHGIGVTSVHPGFVRTELVPGMEKYPFLVEADVAAEAIVRGIEGGDDDIIVPSYPWRLLVPAMKVLPEGLLGRFFK